VIQYTDAVISISLSWCMIVITAGNDAEQLWALHDQVNSGTLTTAHKRKLLLTISAMIQESM
jgi:hypothetical protein